MAKTSQASMEELHKIFNKFDKNGDGKISCGELIDVLRALGSDASPDEVRRIMSEIDIDGDGFIDLDEFAAFYCGGGSVAEDDGSKDLKDAFDIYDLDRNGLISASELHAVLMNLGEKFTLNECMKMISSVDTDGDGNVNFQEFRKMMSRNSSN